MGKKTKSKQRLDQYYHFAKTQGYRSRAAYKLIQLNRKYNFLNNATAVIDLCAAPGGWMQVAANTMPPNSTIIGVDLDQIKRVQGAMSFKGDITKQETFDRLKKQLKNRKVDAVLNDGAPNVGANWNKDAYTQSQLVLAAFKLSCDFLKEGGHFVTKVFRSTDTNSLMWVFKKFFDKVEMTKPKASRFASAQTFVVGVGYNAPSYIDERYFDPKWVFKDTQGDHFQDQMIGQFTSIDKVLANRRKRGGYDDNAPMHLYKQIPLTKFIESEYPLVCFADFNKITVSEEERKMYYGIAKKMPEDFDELLSDLKVLGKRQIGSLMKWRGKIRHFLHQQREKTLKRQLTEQQMMEEEENDSEEEEDSEEELEQELLQKKRKELKKLRNKQEKRNQMLIKAQAAHQQLNENQEFGEENLEEIFDEDVDLDQLGYEQVEEQVKKDKIPKYISYTPKQLEDNLEQIYELREQRKKEKQEHAQEVKRRKKQRRQERIENVQNKLKSRRFGPQEQEDQNQNDQKPKKKEKQVEFQDFKFQNPLADMDDEDIYISDSEVAEYEGDIDPDEKMEGQLSDDDAYVIPKAQTQMQKRRKKIRKAEKKKEKKLKKDIEDGEQLYGQFEIVKQKQMEDYDINSLAETLAVGKKLLRNHSREEIYENSYSRYNFEDHENLPNWFADDEKKHNYKHTPISKEEFQQEKQRLQAINARVPKKILQAKVRRKIRIQKKLKKTQKKAENVMSQEGIDEVNKLRQVGKMYDKSKRQLKDQKKYVVSKKSRQVGGKDSRKVKHVDRRMKKDKKISKTRHTKRKNKRRGKF